MRQNIGAYVAIVFAMSVWASSFLLTQQAMKTFDPVAVVTMRMTLAAVFLGVWGLLSRQLQALKRGDALLFLAAGFVQPFLYFICEAYGLRRVSAEFASVELSTVPLFAPIFAFLFLRERVRLMNVVGILVSFCGVLMLVLEGGELVVDSWGILLLFGAVMSAVMYSVLLRKIPGTYSNVTIVFYIHAVSLLFFWPTFFIVDGGRMRLSEIADEVCFSADLGGLGVLELSYAQLSLVCIVALAAIASVVCYVLFCMVVRRIGVTRANVFCNIQPAVTALVVFLLFGQTLPLIKWVGIAVVIAGLFISQKEYKRVRIAE